MKLPRWLRGRKRKRKRNRNRPRSTSGIASPSPEVARWMEADHVFGGIHTEDFLYQYIRDARRDTVENPTDEFFEDGRRSAGKLQALLGELDVDLGGVGSFLEFASGYGMVTRHLVKRLEPQRITACDIHPQALEFLSGHLGVRTCLSRTDPAEFVCPQKYDVVFALSFFSHMPQGTWGRWIKALFDRVAGGGLLVFTTHGRETARQASLEIPDSGFYFDPVTEQHDLDSADYGRTLVTPEFVRAEVRRQTGQPVVLEKLAHWWGHQDVFAVRR